MNRNKIITLGFFMILMMFIRPAYAESLDKVNAPEDKTSTVKPAALQEAIPVSDKEDRGTTIQSRNNDLITVNLINPEDKTSKGKPAALQEAIPVSDKEDRGTTIQSRNNDLITVNLINPEDKTSTVKPAAQEAISVSDKEDRGTTIQSRNNELITVNLINVDISEALSALSMKQEINISTAKDVSGDISVHLYKVPLNEALDAITTAGACSYQKRGDLYYVYKPREAVDPLAGRFEMRVFKLRYADIENIEEILSSIPGMRLIKIHKPSQTIIVEDTPENVKKIETIIQQWEVMPKQVVIEAKILEISLNDDMAMGVNWERVTGNARFATGGLSTAVQPDEVGEMISPLPTIGSGIFANFITGVGRNFDITAALDALQTETKVDTLTTPKIIAIHGKPAKVQVGGEQGYKVTTVSDGISQETVEFIQTGTILEITPYINDNGKVLLYVKPSIQSATVEDGIPVVKTTEVSTWLMAENGETIFIGGLIQKEKILESKKVPLLGDIPLLGGLFSRLLRDSRRTELVILITPQIIDGDQGIWTQEAAEKTMKMEENLYNEPLPDHKQFIELLSPKNYDKDKEILKRRRYRKN